MKQRPLGDRVLVKAHDSEAKSSGGMILPDNVSGLNTGTIEAVGPGIYTQNGQLVELTVKPGNKVYFVPNTGQEVTLDGSTFMLCREGDLLMFDNE